MQYWNPILKLNIEHNIETNFGFFCTKLFWTTTATIEMGFDIIEINLVGYKVSPKKLWREAGVSGVSSGELGVAVVGWASQSKVLNRAQLETSLG